MDLRFFKAWLSAPLLIQIIAFFLTQHFHLAKKPNVFREGVHSESTFRKPSPHTPPINPTRVRTTIRLGTALEAIHEVRGSSEVNPAVDPVQAEGHPEKAHLDPDVGNDFAFRAGAGDLEFIFRGFHRFLLCSGPQAAHADEPDGDSPVPANGRHGPEGTVGK